MGIPRRQGGQNSPTFRESCRAHHLGFGDRQDVPKRRCILTTGRRGKNSEVPDFNINRSESMKSCKLVDTGTA